MLKSALRGLLISIAIIFISRESAAFQENGLPPSPTRAGPTKGGPENQAKKVDYSNESFVIEKIADEFLFSADGTGHEERSVRIRIQSDAAVQQLGVLTNSYHAAFERADLFDARVTKPDGTIVTTSDSDAQDVPSGVASQAPAYSDTRVKQLPVKGLGVGDVLEWRTRTTRTAAEIPGQFWLSYNFFRAGVILDETLRVTVPADKFVKTSSPGFIPEVRAENGQRIFTWKNSQLEHPDDSAKKTQPRLQPHPNIEMTSFKSWEEVGQWYGALQQPRLEVTPAIQAKAAELVRGLSSRDAKERAIYQFVSTKFRYISVSFGEGRYQPHSAGEVLANQYGDCKDKHTLFAALLKAVGIDAWPALVGAGVEFDPDVPSPSQFNHVITYIPEDHSAVWLDTTPEVAPFGLLQAVLRDQKVLVIPENGIPTVMTTPDSLPFPAEATMEVKSKLSADGTLTASFDISARGDDEVILKSVFHATAPAQWRELAQNMARAMGYEGTVTGVAVDNPANTEAPFHYTYAYQRKTFSDWENRRISPPIPPLGIEPSAESETVTEPFFLGALGKSVYRATVQLPEGYSAEIPNDLKLQTNFADYNASYSVNQGLLSAERTLTRKKSKVAVGEWEEYRKFVKAVTADENQFIQLVRSSGRVVVTRASEEAGHLIQAASQAIQDKQINQARDLLAQAGKLNPKQSGLWAMYGYFYAMQGQTERAIEAMRKEIAYHPGSPGIYDMLATAQRRNGQADAALRTLRQWVEDVPDNLDAILALTSGQIAAKQYSEAISPLQAALKNNPGDVRLEMHLLEALLRGGKKSEGSALLAALREQKLDAESQNEVAYVLADTGTEVAVAQELARKSVSAWEEQSKAVTLATLSKGDLRRVLSLGATWDTLGWAYFGSGDLVEAERFLQAAWVLLQSSTVADHLGQVYERQGKKSEAIRAYRLALAVYRDMPQTSERLEKLGGTMDSLVAGLRNSSASPQDELSQMRSVPVPGIAEQTGSAEFFVLFSVKGVEEVRFVSGSGKLEQAAGVLSKLSYNLPFPDTGPERIARRGILSCSQYTTPKCNLVLFLPANTQN